MIRFVCILGIALPLHVPVLAADRETAVYSDLQLSGTIGDRRVVEASGLARSHLVAHRLWTMNDGGSKPQLFAFGSEGEAHGAVSLVNSQNIDWEDLASFEHDGKAWLLVADIGDNEAKRRYCTLYVVEEPAEPRNQRLKPQRTIRFTYPEGPLDAEAVAVDVETDSVLVLVKRTVPARLYRVPLSAGDDNSTHMAEMLGEIASLPQPSRRDLDRAPVDQSWHWQPTAMDLAPSGRMAVVLTYRSAYLFERELHESWLDAMQKPPLPLDLGGIELAEAVAFGYKGNNVFVTVEGRNPALYRFDRRP